MSKRKLIICGLALAAFAIVSAVVLAPRESEQTWRLPDGSTLRLLKITIGTSHRYRYGNRVQDFLYPLVPTRYRTNFNFQVVTVSTAPEDKIVLWFKRSWEGTNVAQAPSRATVTVWSSTTGLPVSGGTNAVLSPTFYSYQAFSFSVVDGSGLETPATTSTLARFLDPTTVLDACVLPSFPRGARMLHLRLYWRPQAGMRFVSTAGPAPGVSGPITISAASISLSSSTVSAGSSDTESSPVAKIGLPNPARQRPAHWVPEPLPASRRTNGLEITLANLETGCVDPGRNAGAFSRATFAVRENGQPTRDWIATQMVLRSASGELLTFSNLVDHGSVEFPATLWLEEPAWKVDVRFMKLGSFQPDELWTVRGIPLPEIGHTVSVNTRTNMCGVGLRLASVSTETPANVQLDLLADPSIGLNLVEARDDRGRTIAFGGWHWEPQVHSRLTSQGDPSPTERTLVFFPLFGDARTIDVTFGVRRSLDLEFCVKPVLAETNTAAPK